MAATDGPEPVTTITSHCLCGANHFSITIPSSSLPLDHAHFCHCTSCRHVTGTLALSVVTWPGPLPSSVTAADSKVTTFAITSQTNTYHCSTCGTLLFEQTTDPDEPDNPWVGVATGTLDDPVAWYRFTSHTFVPDTKDGGTSVWLDEVKGVMLEKYREWEMEGANSLLQEGWEKEHEKAAVEAGADGKSEELDAHCQCGGVRFKVIRPNKESLSPSIHARPDRPGPWWISPTSPSHFIAGLCVCDSCRLSCGQEFMAWAFIPDVNLRLDDGSSLPSPPLFGTLRSYRHSDRATRYFCGTCGACAFWNSEDRPRLLDVAVGLLDARTGARAEDWLHWLQPRCANAKDGLRRGLLTEELTRGLVRWHASREVTEASVA